MTKEELLKPRFKCIADFPGNEWFEVGEVYEVGFNGVILKDEIRKWDKDNYIITQPEKYPAIFLKLNWWEERKLEDIPKYIKNDDGIYELLDVPPEKRGSICKWIVKAQEEDAEFGVTDIYVLDNHMLPATEEEYLNYINK